jgi:hypothetical protein
MAEVASNGDGKKARIKDWRVKTSQAAARSPQRTAASRALQAEVGF